MNISYLIENTNHVYIDNKLLDDYHKQGKKLPGNPNTAHTKSISPKDPKRLNSKNKSPSNDRTKPFQKELHSKTAKTKAPHSNVFSEE